MPAKCLRQVEHIHRYLLHRYYATVNGTAHPSGTPEYTTIFSGVRVSRSFVLWCFVDRCLSFYHYFLLFIVLAASSLRIKITSLVSELNQHEPLVQ
jgi:hypothetical protein